MSPESPEQDTEYTLTPRTEAKYSKIDEDFQIIMQRNHQMTTAAGQQRVMSANSNYAMPVTVPIPGSYGESTMLQASPQMTHPNISPRPSSSETDSGRWWIGIVHTLTFISTPVSYFVIRDKRTHGKTFAICSISR